MWITGLSKSSTSALTWILLFSIFGVPWLSVEFRIPDCQRWWRSSSRISFPFLLSSNKYPSQRINATFIVKNKVLSLMTKIQTQCKILYIFLLGITSGCLVTAESHSRDSPNVHPLWISTLGKLFPRSGQQRWLSEHPNAEIWWKTLWLRSHPHVRVSSAMGFCCSTGPMPSPACVSTELGHGQDGHRGCARNSQILLELCITLRATGNFTFTCMLCKTNTSILKGFIRLNTLLPLEKKRRDFVVVPN